MTKSREVNEPIKDGGGAVRAANVANIADANRWKHDLLDYIRKKERERERERLVTFQPATTMK